MSSSPALPLSGFWFLYLAGLGLVFPYQSLYFHENAGLDGSRLGVLLAVRPLVGMLFQPLWGHVADRTGGRAGVLALLAVGGAAAYAVVPLADGFAALLLAFAFASLFTTSVIPMATSVTMAALASGAAERFGRVRVWGTVGFLVLVVAFPSVLDRIQAAWGLEPAPGGPSEPGLGLIFWLASALTLAAAACALPLGRGGAFAARAVRGDLRRLLRHGPYARLLAFSFGVYFFVQAPILLFPVFLQERGGSLETLSRMWIAMLALEIPLVYWSGATLRRLGPRGLLAMGAVAEGTRWLGCALVTDLRAIAALQLLHGVSIAGLVVGISLYVDAVVPDRLRSSGQGLVAMVGVSLASTLSSVTGGWLLERLGAAAPYAVGGAGALALAACVPWLLPHPVRAE